MRPDTCMGGQGPYWRSQEHLGKSNEVKDHKNIKKYKSLMQLIHCIIHTHHCLCQCATCYYFISECPNTVARHLPNENAFFSSFLPTQSEVVIRRFLLWKPPVSFSLLKGMLILILSFTVYLAVSHT